jgi:hypothetical protein
MKDSAMTDRRELSVIHECAAESCTFNDHHVCEAGEIDVMPTERGPICATYTPEDKADGAEGLSNAR